MVIEWVPPAGMQIRVAQAWRKFYSAAWTKYEITPTQYRDLYIAQHGCCYICRKARGKNPDDPNGRGAQRLSIDHNHVTGAVRGLLCGLGDHSCNRIIGWLSHAQLERALEYVETEPGQTVLNWSRATSYPWEPAKRDELVRQILELT